MAKQRAAWVKDMLVFIGFTLLNAGFLSVVVVNTIASGTAVYRNPMMWVIALPSMLANSQGWCPELAAPLFFLNPLIYGLTWWAMWKMARLHRAKPAE